MSPEPPSKRILLDNFKDRLKLINVFFVSILIFILIYNVFPIIKFQDPFIKGFFIALKLLTALSGMIIVFIFSTKVNYVKKYVILYILGSDNKLY